MGAALDAVFAEWDRRPTPAQHAERMADGMARALGAMAALGAAAPEPMAPMPTGAAAVEASLRAQGLLPHDLVDFVDACGDTLNLGFRGDVHTVQRHRSGYLVGSDGYCGPDGEHFSPRDAFADVLGRIRENMCDEGGAFPPKVMAAELVARGHAATVTGKSVRVTAAGRVLTLVRTPRKKTWNLFDDRGASVLRGGPAWWQSVCHEVDCIARGIDSRPVPISLERSAKLRAMVAAARNAALAMERAHWARRPSYTSPWSPCVQRRLRAGVPAGLTCRQDAETRASVIRLAAIGDHRS